MERKGSQTAAASSSEHPVYEYPYVAHESELPAVEGCEWEEAVEDEELVLATFDGLRESSGGSAVAATLHGARADQSAVLRVLGLDTDAPLAQLVRVADNEELLGASAIFRGHREPVTCGTPLLFTRTESTEASLAFLGPASAQLHFARVSLVPKLATPPTAEASATASSSYPQDAAHSSVPSS